MTEPSRAVANLIPAAASCKNVAEKKPGFSRQMHGTTKAQMLVMIAPLPKSHQQPPPPQEQQPPGSQEQMRPQPIEEDERYVPSGKLKGRVAIVTGGDSGIGRSVA